MAYLDYDGLLYVWTKLKALLGGKVDKVDGKQLSTNDYTTAEKTKLAGLNNYTHPTSSGNKHIPAGGASGQILRWASDGTAQWGNDNNTTYSAFKGATSEADGGTGLVTAPKIANRGQYLRGDGTWATPTNTTYGAASQTTAGLMSAADKKKLDGVASGANNYSHPTSAGNKHIPAGGAAGQILRWSSDGTAVWGADNNTTYSAFKGATADADGGSGLVPTPAKGTQSTGYLRADGTWATPPDTKYGNFKAATASAAGGSGLVPAPAAGKQGQYLRGDGTWATPTNTTYGNASQSASGLMSAADKKKLDGVANGANAYVHPTNAGNKHIPAGGASGQILGYASDGTAQWINNIGLMTGATADADGVTGTVPAPVAGAANRYLRSDGTWVVPPNTTYGNASSSSAGLMSATDKAKLDGIASGANKYSHPGYTARSSGLYKITVDGTGHVSAVTAVAKSDITALGIPSTNTTYGSVTQNTNGLMTSSDKKKLDGFSAASNYALKSDITAMYRYKGSIASYDKLPTSGQTIGDVYDVGDGMNYAWNGSKWDGLGQVFTITKISNTEIDTILAS